MTNLIKKLNFKINSLISLGIIVLAVIVASGTIYAAAAFSSRIYRVDGGTQKIVSGHGYCRHV